MLDVVMVVGGEADCGGGKETHDKIRSHRLFHIGLCIFFLCSYKVVAPEFCFVFKSGCPS